MSRIRRIGGRLAATAALCVALVTTAPPVGAQAADGPPVGIVSAGTAVAVDLNLNLDRARLRNNGTADVTAVDMQFDLVLSSSFDAYPFNFDWNQADPACHTNPANSSYSLLCHYAVHIAPGATADVAVHMSVLPGSASRTAPSPLLKITVGTGATADTATIGPIVRVKRQADITLRVGGTPTGRVGDIVNLQWIVTNNGPDSLARVDLILIAPTGTEWTGAVAAQCNPPAIAYTKYQCTSGQPLAPGHVLTETWQLKIDSATVGSGEILAVSNLNQGYPPDPYHEITDPNLADNTVTFTVQIGTTSGDASGAPPDGGGPGGPQTAGGSQPPGSTNATGGPQAGASQSPSTSAGASAGGDSAQQTAGASRTPVASPSLLRTSGNGAAIGTVGTLVLLAVGALALVGYRRRSRPATVDPPPSTVE